MKTFHFAKEKLLLVVINENVCNTKKIKKIKKQTTLFFPTAIYKIS